MLPGCTFHTLKLPIEPWPCPFRNQCTNRVGLQRVGCWYLCRGCLGDTQHTPCSPQSCWCTCRSGTESRLLTRTQHGRYCRTFQPCKVGIRCDRRRSSVLYYILGMKKPLLEQRCRRRRACTIPRRESFPQRTLSSTWNPLFSRVRRSRTVGTAVKQIVNNFIKQFSLNNFP